VSEDRSISQDLHLRAFHPALGMMLGGASPQESWAAETETRKEKRDKRKKQKEKKTTSTDFVVTGGWGGFKKGN